MKWNKPNLILILIEFSYQELDEPVYSSHDGTRIVSKIRGKEREDRSIVDKRKARHVERENEGVRRGWHCHPSSVQLWRAGNSIPKQDSGEGINLAPRLSFLSSFQPCSTSPTHRRSSSCRYLSLQLPRLFVPGHPDPRPPFSLKDSI